MNDPYAIERRRVRIAELAAIGSVMASIPPEADYAGPVETELRRLCVRHAEGLVRWFESEDARQEAERAELEAERS